MTAIWSARLSASSRYCVVSRSVVPSLRISRIISHRLRRLRGSSPEVGSSRNITFGRATSDAARSRRRRMPPEYVRAGRSAACVSPKRSSTSRERRRTSSAGRWYRRPTSTRFSNPVRFSSIAANCPASPIWLRRASASRTTSKPATSARPPSGSSSVVRMRTPVVFPAPLGPSTLNTVPGATSKSSPFSAWTSPKDFRSPSARMIGPSMRPILPASSSNDTAPGPPSVLTYPGPSPCSNSSTCIAASGTPSRSTASRSRCPKGAVVGFVGRNGAGKTTAMRIALGVLAADAGEVRWRGAPVDLSRCAGGSATCPRNGASTRGCACSSSSSTSAGSTG